MCEVKNLQCSALTYHSLLFVLKIFPPCGVTKELFPAVRLSPQIFNCSHCGVLAQLMKEEQFGYKGQFILCVDQGSRKGGGTHFSQGQQMRN